MSVVLEEAKSSARLRAVAFTDVTIDDQFWSKRIGVNRDVTLPIEYEQLEVTGRVNALKQEWKPGDEPRPHQFWDSDIAKWLEAASYSLATNSDPELDALVDSVIDLLAEAQQPDGYLNSYYTAVEPQNRWKNLRDDHELYCAGHLIEAAVAHFQATGKRSLLDVLCRYADYIDTVFGTEIGKNRGYCGHEEIELALVKLFDVTGNEKYLRLSQYFVDERGQQPHYFDQEAIARGDDPKKYWANGYSYNQSHLPVREQSEVTGHSVRGMYLYSAMADLAGIGNDQALLDACKRIWHHLTTKQMYITAGIGSSRHNEGYTFDYDLPNETAYAETCATIGLVFWAHRMLHLDCDSQYADVMERALYNGVISGVSLDGRKFFYENPLASLGKHRRQEWFGCACCPPNLARLLSSFGQYIYAQSEAEAIVHLYVQSSGKLTVMGQAVTLRQETNYPWDGRVAITVTPEHSAQFALKLRIPDWARNASVSVNGKAISVTTERGYLSIERTWFAGDEVVLDLPMSVERVYANPQIRMDTGRVALQRGPIVYCLESVDNGNTLNELSLSRKEPLTTSFAPELLDGVIVLHGAAQRLVDTDWDGTLYRAEPATVVSTNFTAVPYFAWENREPGEMLVWIRETV